MRKRVLNARFEKKFIFLIIITNNKHNISPLRKVNKFLNGHFLKTRYKKLF